MIECIFKEHSKFINCACRTYLLPYLRTCRIYVRAIFAVLTYFTVRTAVFRITLRVLAEAYCLIYLDKQNRISAFDSKVKWLE